METKHTNFMLFVLVALVAVIAIVVMAGVPQGAFASVQVEEDYSWDSLSGEAAAPYKLVKKDADVRPLLDTLWGQRNKYAMYAPPDGKGEHWRIGCWSTALAQMLYYHKLKPYGKVSYVSSNGYKISENFGSYAFDFDAFVPSLKTTKDDKAVQQVAKYGYFVSTIIQKDYGTTSYLISGEKRMDALEKHFRVEAKLYTADNAAELKKLQDIITSELNAERPVMMYMRGIKDNVGHAVVIDGYTNENGNFMVHINMGHEGVEDDWYNFYKPILHYDDVAFKRIAVVKPLPKPVALMKKGAEDNPLVK